MTLSLYVCPLAVAQAELAREDSVNMRGWHTVLANPQAADLVLVQAQWIAQDAQDQFEAHPGVVLLGDPWEMVPAIAVPVLESFRLASIATRATAGLSLKGLPAVRDVTAPIDGTHTVAQALRKAAPQLVGPR